ncbi:histidine kinase hhk6p [Phlyctema vagabunda]|uniref:Histidine kinase hhk6p n=1 Tax=Phlyctema vagabunda TaxID=108571 RepID=A0ABR4P9B5_9HELO
MQFPAGPVPATTSLDVQLAVLRQLPTPVLVLSSNRLTIFANRAAEKLLVGHDAKDAVHAGILGCEPVNLGIVLLHHLLWQSVFKRLAVAVGEGASGSGAEENRIEDLEVLLTNPISQETAHLQVAVSVLKAGQELFYMLSFDRRTIKRESHITIDSVLSPPEHAPLALPNGGGESQKVPMIDHEYGGRLLRMRRAIFDSYDIAGFVITADEKYYLTNKKTRELLGNVLGDERGAEGKEVRNRLEIWNETFTDVMDLKDYPGIRLVRSRKPFSDYVCGFTHQTTKQKIAMKVSGQCLYDDDTGEFLGGVCWCTDLQESSLFLQEKQERLLLSHETICSLMPHMVWTTRPDGYVDWFSKRWYDFTGMTAEESVGSGYQSAIHQDDMDHVLRHLGKGLSEGVECEVELRYRRKDGVYRWMLARASPLRDSEGKLLKWYGTNTDIHELVMARLEASRNTQQMFTVLAHAEVNLFAINTERKVTMAEGNMYWEEKGNRVNKSNVVGQDALQVIHSSARGFSDFEKNIQAVLSGDQAMAVSEDKMGDRIYRTRVVADLEHNSADGSQKPAIRGVLGLSIDVTDFKARMALEVQNAQLKMEEKAAKDASRIKSQFLANMSHEMRTPTAGVIGMVDLLSDDTTLSEEQREYVNSIQLSAKALLTIVNDILDFSKIESGRLDIEEVPFDLENVVSELCKLLGVFANQKGLEFIYDNTMPDSPVVLGDPGRIRQVLSNLLTNALKFTKEGSVTLSLVAKRVGEDGLDVEFVVQDTGIGIEKKVLDKLFQPFSQGDSSTARLYGGTGLGLTISRNLANLMKGSISLESTPSVGSTATFQVPFKLASQLETVDRSLSVSPPNPGFRMYRTPNRIETLRAPHSSPLSSAGLGSLKRSSPTSPLNGTLGSLSIDNNVTELSKEARSNIHVLVVEDNAINQTIAIKNIQKLGFTVSAVWNGQEALSYLLTPSSTQPRPAIILMDVQMPVMDGYEATRILRSEDAYAQVPNGSLRDIPVIAMTASAIQGDAEKCHQAGMDDYLAKPVEKLRLEAMLVKWALNRKD